MRIEGLLTSAIQMLRPVEQQPPKSRLEESEPALLRIRRDSASLSDAARAAFEDSLTTPEFATTNAPLATESETESGAREPAAVVTGDAATATGVTGNELNDDEVREVDELERRDHEVRSHEQAHKAAAGQYGGSISLSYETGPDGKRYATEGSVPIDTSPMPGDPNATIQKLRQVQSAALAPSDPSAADRRIAAVASRGIQRARVEARSNGGTVEDVAPEAAEPNTSSSATSALAETATEPVSAVATAEQFALKNDARSARSASASVAAAAYKRLESPVPTPGLDVFG